jgi:hypothetical protein
MTAVLSSRRRALLVSLADDMIAPFLVSLTSRSADDGQVVGARSWRGMA